MKRYFATFYGQKWLAVRLVLPLAWLSSQGITQLYRFVSTHAQPTPDPNLFVAAMLYNLSTIVVFFLLYPDLISKVVPKRCSFKKIFSLLLRALGLVGLAILFLVILSKLMPKSTIHNADNMRFFGDQPLAAIIAAAFINSLKEELYFRELALLWPFGGRKIFGYLWQIVFALLHLYQSLGAALFALIIGSLFYSYHQRQQHLYTIVFAHSIYNLFIIWINLK